MFGYILASSCSNLCWKHSSPKTLPFINQPYSCGDSPQTTMKIYNLPTIKSSIGRQDLSEYNTTLFPSVLMNLIGLCSSMGWLQNKCTKIPVISWPNHQVKPKGLV